MKKSAVLILLVILMASTMAFTEELKGRTVIGIRAPFMLPILEGNNFSLNGSEYQPFMRGWDFTFEAKKGISDHFMIGLTAGYTSAYDDTSKFDDRGDVASKEDNASAKLTGILFGVNAEYYYLKDFVFQPYLLAGLGIDFWKVKDLASDDSHGTTDMGIKIGTGLLIPIKDNISIDLQAKLTFEQINLSSSVPDGFYGPGDWSEFSDRPFRGYFEPSIGLQIAFGGTRDSDKDGVNDNKDNCPGTPLGAKVDKNGCPIDTDGDGVYDGLDQCPDTPKGAKVNAAGCPLDSDNDGVYDGIDRCPGTAKGLRVDEFGCPFDSDNDGVHDGLDKCLDTPKGVKVDAQGCPMDSDRDGVYDGIDVCPGTPIGVTVDAAGCPLVKKMEIAEKITLHINYASNSAEPDDISKKQLDSIAYRIMAYPDTKVEIRGFTDNQGAEAYNLELSRKRAEGVMAYLESKGVKADQMTAKGFGEDPKYFAADNSTSDGRRQNRRVEIESVK
nr:OmpA family protein [candidate division Zixibacteria bacterium]